MLLIAACDPHVPPGLVSTVIAHTGAPHRTWNPGDAPDLGGASGLIILGGRMGANDEDTHPFIADIKEMVRKAENDDLPVLGICLGGQIMAEALGGRMIPGRHGQKGTTEVILTPLGLADPLFEGVPYKFVTFEWHNDSFEMPEGAVLLAVNPACPVQAFRLGRAAYGLQFHPEMTGETAYKWAREGNHAEVLAGLEKDLVAHLSSGGLILSNFVRMAMGDG